ncbi:PH domain-containing protein [Microbacterium sediminicola]|uniref:PH domain-containing protein n=1 Tax=Microbacterium sediminicola TaxID=415210 RepID=A0ABP4UGC5_9MICO
MTDDTSSSAAASPPRAVASLSDGEWHRLHPLTPLLRGGLVLVIVGGILIANLRERLVEVLVPWLSPDWSGPAPEDPIDYVLSHNLVAIALLVVIGVLALLVVVFSLSWRFHTFRITGEDVEVRSGVVFRTHRRAPLDRVQGVNLTRPFIARLVGLAKLEVVGAGNDGNVKLEYLATARAEEVRADILRLASGRRLAQKQAAAPETRTAAVSAGITGLIAGPEAPVDEPESVVHIPVGRLVASNALSGTTIVLLVAIAAIITGAVTTTGWLLFVILPTIIGFGAFWVRTVTRSLRYSIAPTPSGVRITYGLLTTVTEIIPPGRIHAVEVRQPLMWRPFGWWSIRINRMSGRSSSDGSNDQFGTVLPVGDRADVARVLGLVLPGIADAEGELIFDQGALGPTSDDPYTNTPRRARLLRPLSWQRNGYVLGEGALLLRRGRIWRSLAILPLARLQSIGISQGPLARSLRLANIRAHTVVGRVSGSLRALDRDGALDLFAKTEAAALVAAASDHSHRWAGDA